MRLLIFGAGGMLGRALLEAATARLDARARMEPQDIYASQADITNVGQVDAVFAAIAPDVVINAAGRIPHRHAEDVEMIRVNAIGPHIIATAAQAAGAHFVQVSTDCVFAGDPVQWYIDTDPPDAADLYGRSKMLGETLPQTDPNAAIVVVRTSFIGLDHGLLRWLLDSEGQTIEGWTSARWSGSTVWEVARGLLTIAERLTAGQNLAPILHLATAKPWTKCAVLMQVAATLGLDVRIGEVEGDGVNRALEPSWMIDPLADLGDARILDELREKVDAGGE